MYLKAGFWLKHQNLGVRGALRVVLLFYKRLKAHCYVRKISEYASMAVYFFNCVYNACNFLY